MYRIRLSVLVLAGLAIAPAASACAQLADVSITPFVSFLSVSGHSPLGGLAMAFSGGPGAALRLNARTAFRNTYAGSFGAGSLLPPWGADADLVIPISGHPFGSSNRSPSTVAFIGLGAAATDTAESRVVAKNWSYGLGTVLPLGSRVDLFADSRWRVSKLVLPTAKLKPSRAKELRFGLTFHVGGTTLNPGGRRSR